MQQRQNCSHKYINIVFAPPLEDHGHNFNLFGPTGTSLHFRRYITAWNFGPYPWGPTYAFERIEDNGKSWEGVDDFRGKRKRYKDLYRGCASSGEAGCWRPRRYVAWSSMIYCTSWQIRRYPLTLCIVPGKKIRVSPAGGRLGVELVTRQQKFKLQKIELSVVPLLGFSV